MLKPDGNLNSTKFLNNSWRSCHSFFCLVSDCFLFLSSVGLWLLNGQQPQDEVSEEHTHTHTHSFLWFNADVQLFKPRRCERPACPEPFPFIPIYICLTNPVFFKFLISFFKEIMPHLCTPTWLHFNFCFSIVFCWCLHVVLWCVYTPSSPTIPPPPPVLSVPTISKGRVSATSLQRSRSDVDVNAAAVAKHRYAGQSRAAGHLPPGSCSSLGKGTAWWNEWLVRRRHQSVWHQQFFGSDGLVFVKFLTFSWRFLWNSTYLQWSFQRWSYNTQLVLLSGGAGLSAYFYCFLFPSLFTLRQQNVSEC